MNSHWRGNAKTEACEGIYQLTKFAPETTGGNAVESTVQREGGEQVIGEELTGEVDCGGRRTAGRKRRKRREGRRVSERGVERARRGGGLFRLLEATV
jgi:hypothetical protein